MGSTVDLSSRDEFMKPPRSASAGPEDFVTQLKRRQRAGTAVARKSRADFFKQPKTTPSTPVLGGGSNLGG